MSCDNKIMYSVHAITFTLFRCVKTNKLHQSDFNEAVDVDHSPTVMKTEVSRASTDGGTLVSPEAWCC